MSCTHARDCSALTSLQLYLREIKDDVLLTSAEECELAMAIARGDSDARARMIRCNLRLVVKIARDFVGRGVVFDDLIGEGNLGLIRAAEEFDPRFGTRFSTYASYWIKQAIRHALINTTSTIRLPAHMVGLLTKWRRAERALRREAGRVPTFEEIAAYLHLSETQKSLVGKARQARQLKLEGSITADVGRWSPNDSIDRHEAPDLLLEADDERDILFSRMDRLDARERAILSFRYGLEGELPLTLKEIGRRLGVTREWVRKIELRAVRKLDDRAAGPPRRSPGRPARFAPAAEPPRAVTTGPSPAGSGTVQTPSGPRSRRPRSGAVPSVTAAPRS